MEINTSSTSFSLQACFVKALNKQVGFWALSRTKTLFPDWMISKASWGVLLTTGNFISAKRAKCRVVKTDFYYWFSQLWSTLLAQL
jgi:hypothetical protein